MAEEFSSNVALQVGDIAPDYKLRSTEGKPVSAREAAASYTRRLVASLPTRVPLTFLPQADPTVVGTVRGISSFGRRDHSGV